MTPPPPLHCAHTRPHTSQSHSLPARTRSHPLHSFPHWPQRSCARGTPSPLTPLAHIGHVCWDSTLSSLLAAGEPLLYREAYWATDYVMSKQAKYYETEEDL